MPYVWLLSKPGNYRSFLGIKISCYFKVSYIRLCQNQTCKSPHHSIKEVQHRHVIISPVSSRSQFILYDCSSVRTYHILTSVIVLRCIYAYRSVYVLIQVSTTWNRIASSSCEWPVSPPTSGTIRGLIWSCVYRASYCNVLITNEMHNSYNQFFIFIP